MASLTIRNLDPAIKQRLREEAAKNGRSMEEQARVLLAAAPSQTSRSPFKNEQTPVGVAGSPVEQSLAGKRILLIISGGIAAYKCLDLIRRLRERGASVRPLMTQAAREFVTDLSVGALAADKVYTDLFSREDEQDVGHIRLARDCDLVLVAPATADLMAKMAHGHANDLASAVLLASNRPMLLAPAMNPAMWSAPATIRNFHQLQDDGKLFVGPEVGEMAEKGEAGTGRMSEPMSIVRACENVLNAGPKPLTGKTIIVTSGPTHEPIDPVRYIANRSSGKQGHAIAAALSKLGATVKLVSGPVSIPDPHGVDIIRVEQASEMLDTVEQLLPADAAVMVAAVADWRVVTAGQEKIKKKPGKGPAPLELTENPDILKTVGHHRNRPQLVVGFAAETQNLEKNARTKLESKGADFIVANDVSPETGIMGGDRNRVRIISRDAVDAWPDMSKSDVAAALAERIAAALTVETVAV